ncbi:hypothetical protein QF035_003203 [Streptomyces umbrinus]|uniref:Uncharacterized protein n=1 Tax=Streptomyces umbrinus TaxID=67370 RepID=A0ABU0SPY5_9ACTN|nr:hypothetical protein [Streptomyces umbrinus]MDQ1025621.1 hypothetical protein [Streptomyces umbrinus]
MLVLAQQGGDTGVEDSDRLLEPVRLVQVVLDHEGVVVGEVAVQCLDQGGDLGTGLADGKIRKAFTVAFTGDQGCQDRPSGLPGHIGQHGGELHPGVLQLLLQPLDLPACRTQEFGAAPGQVTQFPHHAAGDEGRHHHSRRAGPGQERGVARIALAAPDPLQVRGVDQHQVQLRLQQVVDPAPVVGRCFHDHHVDLAFHQPGQEPT